MQRPPKKFVPHPFAYHQEIDVEIQSLTNLGSGVARVDGWVVGRTLGRWNALLAWFDEAGIPARKLREPRWSSPEYRQWHAETRRHLLVQSAGPHPKLICAADR